MKILILNYEFPPLGGGAGPVSHEVAKGYVTRGYTVDVVTMSYRGLAKFETVDGVNVFRVPSLRSKKEICRLHEMLSYVISATRFLHKRLKHVHYDISHSHFLIPTGIISLWAKKKFGLEYIITAHGSDVPGYNPDRFTVSHMFTKPILNAVCANAKAIIAPSHFLRELILKSVTGIENKLLLIPNGIDSNTFLPRKKQNIIVSTGRLLPRKGFQYLIEAVSGEDIGYEVHICGDGPMMPRLREMAKLSKTKIVFHGWLNSDSEEYKDLLGSAAIYCLCSLRENSSVALLEGMSAGCAVVTTNVSGCKETIGDAGVMVPPQDARALTTALTGLINNPSARAAYQHKARDRAIKCFDWNEISNRHDRLLASFRV